MKIRIFDVGRARKSTTIDIDDGPADYIARAIHLAVKRMKAVASRDIEVTWDKDTGKGSIYAGAHCVGSSEVAL